jgi:hypothetical protein
MGCRKAQLYSVLKNSITPDRIKTSLARLCLLKTSGFFPPKLMVT